LNRVPLVSAAAVGAPRVLLYLVEHRFHQTPDGRVWTVGQYPYGFFKRYLASFDEVRVLSRVIRSNTPPERAIASAGPGVVHVPLPDYQGLAGVLTRAPVAVLRAVCAACSVDAVVVRSPSTWGFLPALTARARGSAVGVEVIGDPATLFARNAFIHPLRPVIRALAIGLQSNLCRHARAVLYVSESLHCRYKTAGVSVVVSDAGLGEAAYALKSRALAPSHEIRIINVGTFEQIYKGQDVLLRAVARLAARPNSARVSVAFVGSGKHQAACVALAAKLNLTQQAKFYGQISSGEAIRELLDASDVMVHASYTEGMPRVIIEAMARGLPCISTRVGGVPELLDDNWLVPAGDEVAMGKAILDLMSSPDEYARQSHLNLERSRLHSEDAMQIGYNKFLKSLSDHRR